MIAEMQHPVALMVGRRRLFVRARANTKRFPSLNGPKEHCKTLISGLRVYLTSKRSVKIKDFPISVGSSDGV